MIPTGRTLSVEHGKSADAVSDHQGDCMVNGVVHMDGDDMGGHDIFGFEHTVLLKALQCGSESPTSTVLGPQSDSKGMQKGVALVGNWIP